jgi:rhodanese-related sulfurtransferase
VVSPGREEEAVTRLSRVGFDRTLGYLLGGVDAWKKAGKEIDTLESITAEDLKQKMENNVPIIDVRNDGEYTNAHIPEAVHAPLGFLNNYINDFPHHEKFYLHCAGGYRSVIAASILKSRGIHNVADVAGGFAAIKEAGISIES